MAMVQPATRLKVVRPPRVLDVGGEQIEGEEGKEDKAAKKRRMLKQGKGINKLQLK